MPCSLPLYSRVNQLFAYICPLLFLDFLPTYVATEHWVELPVLHSRFSLVICFIHSINSVYSSIPIYWFLPPHPLPSLVSLHLFSMCLYCCFVNKIISAIFLHSILNINIQYSFFSFWLISNSLRVLTSSNPPPTWNPFTSYPHLKSRHSLPSLTE